MSPEEYAQFDEVRKKWRDAEAEVGRLRADLDFSEREARRFERLNGRLAGELAERDQRIAAVLRKHVAYRGTAEFDSCQECNQLSGWGEIPYPCDIVRAMSPGRAATEINDALRSYRRG